MHLLQKGFVESVPSDAEGLMVSFKKLQGMVDQVHEYVKNVVVSAILLHHCKSLGRASILLHTMCISQFVLSLQDGKITGDPGVGRYLADTLSVIPFMDEEHFERLFNERLQELLLVLYLANLVKAQIAIGDKVGMQGSML